MMERKLTFDEFYAIHSDVFECFGGGRMAYAEYMRGHPYFLGPLELKSKTNDPNPNSDPLMEKIAITKTNLALVVKCKCGGTVAATMLYGGISIDEDFTDTIANEYNNGGKIELLNTDETKVTLDGCRCSQ